MSLVKQRYYFYDFFKGEAQIPKHYSYIASKCSNSFLYQSGRIKNNNQGVFKVNHVPDYLKVSYGEGNELRVKKIYRHIGYAIDLKGYSDIDEFIVQHFKNARKIRRYVKRLEASFNISYKRYYGHIDKSVYDDLLERLYNMVKNRFESLNDTNNQIKDESRWRAILEDTYELIKEKRASLLVIYEDDKPILINIAHHWGVVFYDFMFSFDIDYLKFSLGHISFYKQIEWCINEGYEIFDTGPGEYPYKKRWSNKTYNLLQHIVYNRNSNKNKLLANIEVAFTILSKYKETLSIKPYKRLIKRKVAKKNRNKKNYKITNIPNANIQLADYENIAYENSSHYFLKKVVFDFIYTKSEHKADVEVFKNIYRNRFLIRGRYSSMVYDVL